jgi:chemotaxis protein histidine kinase CheA
MTTPRTLTAPAPEQGGASTAVAEPESVELEVAAPIAEEGLETSDTGGATPTPEAKQKADEQPSQPTASVPTPLPTPRPQGTNFAEQLRQQYQTQQRELETTQAQLADIADAEAVRQYRTQLETQYPGADFSPLIQQYQTLVTQTRAAERERVQSQQNAEAMRNDQAAKEIVARNFSQQSGMPINELMAFDNPLVMRAEARAWKAEHEAAALKQAQVKPQTPTNSTSSRSRISVNSDNIDKLYLEGKVSGDVYRRFRDTGEIRG